ncbi:UNVERIFIED_CONTAM: hypothetical protein Slati_2366300 [Sesamum latifolium]|uniref:Uncharacterized protein n=1 Tax=Sesamum latifolium TaxID=2727402 RepID=A0AAW2WB71_9LAMI
MWEKLLELGRPLSMSWLILGDFNCVKSPTEKQLGVPPTWYELKDFADCCLALGLHDVPTTGCYYTWYSNSDSNPVCCKLNRVLLNNDWLEAGLHCAAHFNASGCLSDHSSDHPNFIVTVEEGWSLNVEVRAKEVDLALQDAQLHLESNLRDAAVWDSLGDFRKKAVFLVEAQRHFYYQKAKIHFLKQGDRNTKFFHDMVKRNTTRNSILAVTKTDGLSLPLRILPRNSLVSTPCSWVPRIRHSRWMIVYLNGGPFFLRSLHWTFVEQSHRQRTVFLAQLFFKVPVGALDGLHAFSGRLILGCWRRYVCAGGSFFPTGVKLLLLCSVLPTTCWPNRFNCRLKFYLPPLAEFLGSGRTVLLSAFSGRISAHKTSVFQGCFFTFRPFSNRPEAVWLAAPVIFKTGHPCEQSAPPAAGCLILLQPSLSRPSIQRTSAAQRARFDQEFPAFAYMVFAIFVRKKHCI